jgi:soluble lytic murein transglycosylase-like protein
MNSPKTSRPFEERFLDGYNRAQLRRDVQRVKPLATVALGVSLALGGLALPLNQHQSVARVRVPDAPVPKIAIAVQAETGLAAAFFGKHVPFGSVIYSEAKRNNLSPFLLAAVARAESAFHPTAISPRGAIGVMQLIPRTGRWLGATDLTDPKQNIVAGAKYLAYLSERFGGNEDHVIAAYNAGEGNVRRFAGVPPFRETRDYVDRVHRFQRDLRARMEGQVSDLGIGWLPASYQQRAGAVAERPRPILDIHWTRPEERRVQKLRG